MTITPKEYQKIAIVAGLKGLRDNVKRALIVMATGLGKTFTAAFIAKEYCAGRILFLVHNNFILEHALCEFRLIFDQETKMMTYNGMSKNGAADADIVFATWQTMGRNLKEWDHDHFDLIIVDEAHHSEAETYKPTLRHFTGAKLGITATPDREDEEDIRDVFGTEVVNITLEEAMARNWLPRVEYHVIMDESLDDAALQNIMREIESGKRFSMDEVNRRVFIRKRDEEVAGIINGYKRHRFEVSGKGFEFTFSNKIVDLMTVLRHCEGEFYATWQEASEAARKYGFKTVKEYISGYKQDSRLHSSPNERYPDFPGWVVYLGKEKKE